MENLDNQLLACWHDGLFYVEEFVPIYGYEGFYEVSNFGRVKSLDRRVTQIASGKMVEFLYKGKILTHGVSKSGYHHVALCVNKKLKTITIHRLVSIHFIPNPSKRKEVNHIDGEKGNNHVFNLEWSTRSENNKHAFALGLNKGRLGQFGGGAIPISQFTLDGVWVKDWNSATQAELEAGYKSSGISACVRGKRKKAFGFIWKKKIPI